MAQRVRLRVSTVTETKMFAKKMHRLVKKIQDKPVDSLEQLSEMARKRGENLSFPIEVETETQWTNLLKREGLIVVDVYSGWSGPCTSMFSILRKLKLDTNDDRMVLAAANADGINQLSAFRNQSEPCWLFLGGGKPVKVLRGSNAPNLVRTIKSEFQHELECIEGKAKRTLISIKFEASRRENAVNEAIALGELMALEEEEEKAREIESRKSPTPTSGDEDEDRNAEKEKSPDLFAERYDTAEDEDVKEGTPDKEEEVNEVDEALIQRRKLMEESNVRLRIALRQYTVIAIQSYLIETGAVTEIKDHLSEDFNLIRERYINLNDDDARKIFCIPAQIPDPNPPGREDLLHSETEDTRSEAIDGSLIAEENPENPLQNTSESQGQAKEESGESGEGEVGEDGEKSLKVEREKTPIRMIDVPVPEVIIGDTLILLLECTRVKPLEKKESIEEDKGEGESPQEEEDPFTADYYIIERTGSRDYQTAIDTQPKSLHAMYGKDAYVAGVWCPRTYEGKRFVMLNYFPQFVTEMLIPPVPEPPNGTGEHSNQEHEDKSNSKS